MLQDNSRHLTEYMIFLYYKRSLAIKKNVCKRPFERYCVFIKLFVFKHLNIGLELTDSWKRLFNFEDLDHVKSL
jgi:hypothetical protein